MLPLLTILADGMGIFGGLLIGVFQEGLSPTFYLQRTAQVLTFDDLWLGLAKPVMFAFLIAVIGCYNGLSARGGADGVGRATTHTVYVIAISVLIFDFFITKLFLAL
jgi:phospholipid/cholesterol/gamma-HCH transport system permease protein